VAGIGKKRCGGNDELRVCFDKLVDPLKYGQLSRRGQGRLGFVEYVQASEA